MVPLSKVTSSLAWTSRPASPPVPRSVPRFVKATKNLLQLGVSISEKPVQLGIAGPLSVDLRDGDRVLSINNANAVACSREELIAALDVSATDEITLQVLAPSPPPPPRSGSDEPHAVDVALYNDYDEWGFLLHNRACEPGLSVPLRCECEDGDCRCSTSAPSPPAAPPDGETLQDEADRLKSWVAAMLSRNVHAGGRLFVLPGERAGDFFQDPECLVEPSDDFLVCVRVPILC
jgi:hypothetical protein